MRHLSHQPLSLPVAMLITTASALLITINSFEPERTWALTHWAFNYEHEFLKRALVGEIWRMTGWDQGLNDFKAAATWVLATFAITLTIAFISPLFNAANNERKGVVLFATLAACCPATLAHAAFDLGRLDQINLLISIAAALALSSLPPITGGVLATSLMGATIFIHEASYFMYVPAILSLWFWKRPRRRTLAPILTSSIILTILMALIWRNGGMSSLDFPSYTRELMQRHGDWIHPRSVMVLFKGTASENITSTLQKVLSTRYLRDHFSLAIFVLGPSLWLARETWKHGGNKLPKSSLLLLTTGFFGPLLLMPIALDYFRWWSIALTNTALITSLLAYSDPHFRGALSTALVRNQKAAFLILLIFVTSGPLGITRSFERPIYKSNLLSKDLICGVNYPWINNPC